MALLLGAPALGRVRGWSDRIALAMVLGFAIPFALGLANVLDAWAQWLAVGVAILVALRRKADVSEDRKDEPVWDVAIGLGAIVALAWPLMVRPVLDGDTLIYHLPNAADFVNRHGLWMTGTRYWWYPPASELFASGILATGGIGVVGLGALLPAALLVLTARSVAMRSGMPPVVGTLGACALLACKPVIGELVSLQNDLWQASLFLYGICEYSPAAFAALALTKPNGLAYAIVASASWFADRRKALLAGAIALAATAIWVVHDTILAQNAIVPIPTSLAGSSITTSIAAHMPHSLAVLAASSWNAGAGWSLLLATGTLAIIVPRGLPRWIALAAFVLFIIIPTSYENAIPQLATGASLRFATPIAAIGLLWLLRLPVRCAPVLLAAAVVAIAVGIFDQWSIFANDATTHDTPYVAAAAIVLGLALAMVRSVPMRQCAGAAAFVLLAAWAGGLARSHPNDYVGNADGGAFAAAAALHASRVVTLGLPAGDAIVVDPGIEVIDGLDAGVCAQARGLGAYLAISSERVGALACGRVVYHDARSTLVDAR